MGLLGDAWKARRMQDPVDGTAHVVGSSQPPDSASSSNVNLNLVVQAEGVPATSIEHSCIAPTKKWPWPGSDLPVTFDRADPDRLKIRWDDIPETGDVAAQQAEALAQQLNQGGGTAPMQMPASGDVSELVETLQKQFPGAQIQVDNSNTVPGAPAPASGGEDDRVAQLERLAKLKESGALTEQEFEREKARILGGS
jgi:hypothetical protein